MNQSKFPPNWDEKRVQEVLAHYESQSEDQAVAEDEAAYKDPSLTTMEIPNDLVSKVRELIVMNSALRVPWDYLHNFIVSRIYHEDSLLSQRTYNFVTINTFLVASLAITFTISGQAGQLSITELPYIISIFGIFFAFLHLFVGRATERAIVFWREYLRVLESMRQLKFDSAMFEFYKEGIVDTGFDIVISRPKKRRENGKKPIEIKQVGLPLAWLPSSLSSTNVWVGVLIPWLAATIWFSVIVILLYHTGENGLIWFLITIFVIFFVLSWFPPFTPATPHADPKVKNENRGMHP